MGWPLRIGRVNFGPTMKDERPPANTLQEFTARQANLSFWQAAGMGLVSPKAVLRIDYRSGVDPTILDAHFAWDNVIYQDLAPLEVPAGMVSIGVGDGDVEIEFETDVPGCPDEDGIQEDVPLVFTGGIVMPNLVAGNILFAFSKFALSDPQNMSIESRDSGGSAAIPFTLTLW